MPSVELNLTAKTVRFAVELGIPLRTCVFKLHYRGGRNDILAHAAASE
jgi:hypothetical protein